MNNNNPDSSSGKENQTSRPVFRTEIVNEPESPVLTDENKAYQAEEEKAVPNETVIPAQKNINTEDKANDISEKSLEGIMHPPPVEDLQTQQAPDVMPVKKGLPKVVFLILGILLLAVLAFLAIRFLPKNIGVPGIGQKGEIVWWGFQEDETAVRNLIEEYQQKNPNVKITYSKQSPQDYRERLTNKLASGEGPDIFEIHNTWIPMFRNDLGAVPTSVFSQNDFAQTFYPVIVDNVKTDKGIVAIPLQYDALTLYVNENIFQLAARSYPATWNDVLSLANPESTDNLIINERGGKIVQTAIAMGLTENVDHWQEILALLLIQNGVNINKPNIPNTDATEQAIIFYKQFGTDFANWNNTLPVSTSSFARGIVAMYLAPSYRAQEILQMNPNLKFRTVKLPQLVKNTPTDPDYSYATYWVQGVWDRSANKDIAWDFLKFLTSRESLEKLNSERSFPKIYPRIDMGGLQISDPIFGSIVAMAPNAKSWYLAADTRDGQNGINSQLSRLFKAAFDKTSATTIQTLAAEIDQTLSRYGIAVR